MARLSGDSLAPIPVLLVILYVGLSVLVIFTYRGAGPYRLVEILSGSMRPALSSGDLILVKSYPDEAYVIGDIVTFKEPSNPSIRITHRITKREVSKEGLLILHTKGDANSTEDPWIISPAEIIGRKKGGLPYIGYLVSGLRTMFGFLVFSVLTFVFFVWTELRWLLTGFAHKYQS